ncbi:nitroreductase [Clostridium botulinum]|uniref:nitroreductase n=1 Tax=Clostridium botulinum TaxID=1491 RepID=UPI0022459C70|nr:nitroreductase [Clostridium botulinum]UZP02307.1 nitroreductase [Clostridium botulinum]UZP05666.1 nitroreductase [Clostridium botulinum]UZP09046.1 nitroreductase [Clostridium botulinum]
MKINKEIYQKIKKEVENDLRNYPYYLISIETPGLGSAIRPDIVINKSLSPSDPVGKSIVDIEYKTALVNAVEFVYDKLDKDSKRIIESSYFRDDLTVGEIREELQIDKNKYYKLKEKAIYKFAMGIGYC